MAENQNQSPGADEQPIDDILKEPSVGMVYDKEKDQAKVISRNPDGSLGAVDPTPENEGLFFVMDQRIPENFYKNLQKYHNNPNINIFVLPRRGLDRMKTALNRYWNRTTQNDVKLYCRCKMHPDGRYEYQMKSHGIRDTEIPWDMLARYGLSYGDLERSGNLRKLKNYEPTGMLKLNYYDNIISGLKGDAKLRLSGKGDRIKVDFKFHTNNPDKQIDGVEFTKEDLRNLETFGNLGRVFETPENRYLVSRDFDTQQTEKIPVDMAYMPRFISSKELTEAEIETLKRGEACPLVLVDKNGNVRETIYQYNVIFHKPMPQITVEQRNALAKDKREERDLERIFSESETVGGQTRKPTPTQTPAPDQQAPTPEVAGQGQGQGEQAPAPGQPTPAPEAAGQHQPSPADLFGQQEPGQIPPVQGQDPKPPVPGQNPQGQEPGRKGQGKGESPRPEVKGPEGSGKGQRKGKHV